MNTLQQRGFSKVITLLQDIYERMRDVFDFGDRIRDPRLALIKIMKGWE